MEETQASLRKQYEGICPNEKIISEHCTCPDSECPMHGRCCGCVAWHRDYGRTPLPNCLRSVPGVTWEKRPG